MYVSKINKFFFTKYIFLRAVSTSAVEDCIRIQQVVTLIGNCVRHYVDRWTGSLILRRESGDFGGWRFYDAPR